MLPCSGGRSISRLKADLYQHNSEPDSMHCMLLGIVKSCYCQAVTDVSSDQKERPVIACQMQFKLLVIRLKAGVCKQ